MINIANELAWLSGLDDLTYTSIKLFIFANMASVLLQHTRQLMVVPNPKYSLQRCPIWFELKCVSILLIGNGGA